MDGYAGKIANAGTQKVEAPYQKKQSGKATVIGGKGTDLRSGNSQKISK